MTRRANTMALDRTDTRAGLVQPALIDEPTFHALYARTAAALRAYVARSLGAADHADDIVQETFLRMLRTPLPTHDLDGLRAYAFRVASNLVVDHLRARRHEAADPAPEPAAASRDQALRVDVARLFGQLKPRERQLVWLAHVEQADHRQIAAALGVQARSVRVLLSRARHKLAGLLRRHGHAPEDAR